MNTATILVVEDNPITRKLMRFALEREGLRVVEAGDGAAALALAGGDPLDLVLQDFVLPDMDGLQLIGGLRRLPRTASTPIVVVTGMVSRLEELRGQKLANTTFLPKPIEPSRLVAVVHAHLAATAPRSTAGRRVLVVDDDPLNLRLASLRLRDHGFEVETAEGGQAGLEKARRWIPEAILSDVLMPGIDGFLLCDAVRRDTSLAGIPVVLLSSAYVDDADQALARAMGANALLLRTSDFGSEISALTDALSAGPASRVPALQGDREALHKERLHIQLDRQLARNEALVHQGAIQAAALSVVRGLAEAMAKPWDLASVLGDVLVHCLDATGLSTGLLYLVSAGGRLELRAQAGLPADARADAALCFGHPEVLACVLAGTDPVAFSVAGGGADDAGLRQLTERLGHTSVLVIPFLIPQERGGLLLLAADSQDFSDRSWIAFASTLGRQFGQTIAVGQNQFRGAASEALHRAERERSEEQYRLLFDGNPHPMWVYDPETLAFLAVNDAAVHLYGYSREEFLAMTLADIRPTADVPHLLTRLAEDASRRGASEGTWKHRRKDGTLIDAEISSNAIVFQGRPARLVLATDVSETRRLEAQLRQAQKMEAIGRLAGGVAHDFNNLLGVISGYAELLRKGLGTEHPQQRRVTEIQKAAERAANLTRQLLAFSRKQVLETKILSLDEVVTHLGGMLHRLIGEDVHLTTRVATDSGHVRADRGQVEQVIVNLVVNARDAMPRGGELVIETASAALDDAYARRHADVRPGPYVMLAVSDTGTGMDAETQSHIFEPFFTTKAEGKGTGLGLATVFGIVKQSGGHISVYSEPARGSTFAVYLPRIDEDVPAPAAGRDTPTRSGQGTILVVEDAEPLRTMIKEILEGVGYSVREYATPSAVLEEIESLGQASVLLTDVVLPATSGPELARAIRAAHPHIKILFMSGYTEQAASHHGVLGPESHFLQKPFTTEGLLGKLRAVLDDGHS